MCYLEVIPYDKQIGTTSHAAYIRNEIQMIDIFDKLIIVSGGFGIFSEKCSFHLFWFCQVTHIRHSYIMYRIFYM